MSNKYNWIKWDSDKNSWINGIAARSKKKKKPNNKTTKTKTPNKKTETDFPKI